MNKRIEQLIEQADNFDILPDAEFCDTDFLTDIDPRRVKMFAELIVRECARVIDRGDGGMSSMDETIWCNVCRDDILKHFGIE